MIQVSRCMFLFRRGALLLVAGSSVSAGGELHVCGFCNRLVMVTLRMIVDRVRTAPLSPFLARHWWHTIAQKLYCRTERRH
jgi:hypothetical protein